MGNGGPAPLHLSYVARIEDCVAIINRIVTRWDIFCSGYNLSNVWSRQIEDRLRLEVIEDTFSFITFFFLLVGFHLEIRKQIKAEMDELCLDSTGIPNFPPEVDAIKTLRIIRNKIVAHTADAEPKGNDTISNRLAYLDWYVGYWGWQKDSRNRRLNTFGLSVGGEHSTHEIPPTFSEMVNEAQRYLRLCEGCVRTSADLMAKGIRQAQPDGYHVSGEHAVNPCIPCSSDRDTHKTKEASA